MPERFNLRNFQNEINRIPSEEQKREFVGENLAAIMEGISQHTKRDVICYMSAAFRKPELHDFASIGWEDIDGFKDATKEQKHRGKDGGRLLLILHTPGGEIGAAQTIFEYLRSEFSSIHTAIPTYAMSAGTMIALGSNQIIMGKQSQMGPTDPYIPTKDGMVSAHSLLDQFEIIKQEIEENPNQANLWATAMHAFGTTLLPKLQDARKAIEHSEDLVGNWMRRYMLADSPAKKAKAIAAYFGSNQNKSHSRRIDRNEARDLGLKVVDLESDEHLDAYVMALHDLLNVVLVHTPAVKIILSSNNRNWIKNAPIMA